MILRSVLVLLVSSGASFAAPLIVRSGDHVGFTRLTIQSKTVNDWTIDRRESTVYISSEEHQDGYDLSRVFQRITNDRVAEITESENFLQVTLGCKCSVIETQSSSDLLVIDIVDNKSDDSLNLSDTYVEYSSNYSAWAWLDSISSLGLIEPPSETDTNTDDGTSNATILQKSDAATQLSDELEISPTDFDLFQLTETSSEAEKHNTESTIESDSETASRNPLLSLEARLAEAIGLAATQGILDIDSATPEAKSISYFDEPNQGGERERLAESEIQHQNFDLSSSAIYKGSQQGLSLGDDRSISCDSGHLFELEKWGSEKEFPDKISQLRNSLFGEFDNLNQEAQVELARAFLHFGFGAEAMEVARLKPLHPTISIAIDVIANVIDENESTTTLTDLTHCSSNIALWAILSTAGFEPGQVINFDVAIQTLNSLPKHIRSILAPNLASNFRQLGNLEKASLALRSISREPPIQNSSALLESAELELKLEKVNPDGALTNLKDVVSSNGIESPIALARFIELAHDTGAPISTETAKLVEAYAQEYKDSEIADTLERALIISLAKSRQFEEALNHFSSWKTPDDETFGEVLSTLTNESEDLVFLENILPLEWVEKASLPQILETSSRLYELGFHESVVESLADTRAVSLSETHQELLAKSQIRLGDPKSALITLGENLSDTSQALRAHAYYDLNERSNAIEAASSLDSDFVMTETFFDSRLIEIREDQNYEMTSNFNLIESGNSLSRAQALVTHVNSLAKEIGEIIDDSSISAN